MLLSYTELHEAVEAGYLRGVDPAAINQTTIDVRLGMDFLRECPPKWRDCLPVVDCANRESVSFFKQRECVVLEPQDFVLAHTMEEFYLPDFLSAEFSLKSSAARNGLEHLNACWIDAGFNSSVLTLELKNMTRYHQLKLRSGMFIGQIKVFRHTEVPAEQSYAARGRYNHDASVNAIKK